jgi:hypothetical protein
MIKRFFVKLYRKIWDFPRLWRPYGWFKSEMAEWYWKGYSDSHYND